MRKLFMLLALFGMTAGPVALTGCERDREDEIEDVDEEFEDLDD